MALVPHMPKKTVGKIKNDTSVPAVLIGAGNRGLWYSSYGVKNPEKLKIVAVAEPVKERREACAAMHRIPDSHVFSTWEDLLDRPLMAEGAIITTQDTMHVDPCVSALKKGYHVMLEKPMALTEKGCCDMVKASRKYGLTLNVCHVLRYTDFFTTVKKIIQDGVLGDIYNIYHAENVPYYHMAHSYVRGNWRNSRMSSPMILAKCCHDLDLIYWFADSLPAFISSFGGLHHFVQANAPEGAPERCTDGCPAEKSCPFHAVNTYLHGKALKLGMTKTDSFLAYMGARFVLNFPWLAEKVPGLSQYVHWRGWPVSTITEDLSTEGIMTALRTGPYGRCVYRCDNDQVDHQVTNIEFENGLTAILNMHGHAEDECRTLRIDGSRGTLRGKYGGGGRLEVHDHLTGKKTEYAVKTDLMGHSEGDVGIMENFVKVLRGGEGLTTAEDSLQSHLMALMAHKSRVTKRVLKMNSQI